MNGVGMMFDDLYLKCSECGKEYSVGQYICDNKDGILEVNYQLPKVNSLSELKSNLPGIWKYGKLLPKVKKVLSLDEGNTPLIRSQKLGKELDIELCIKDEGRNPTNSFKDRAGSVMLTIEKEMNHRSVATSSSGNAAAAIACYAAIAEMDCYVFMCNPTQEKLVSTQSFKPFIFRMDAEIGRVINLIEEVSEKYGWNILNTAAYYNPFAIEGYKTIAFELVEQYKIPDVIVSPVGSGTLVIGIWKGFNELKELGLVDKIPRIIGVQSKGCNPVVQAFENNQIEVKPVKKSTTIAGGIGLSDPGIDGKVTLSKIRETQGQMLEIDDEDILEMLINLPKKEGIFGGPTGVASIAALKKAREIGAIKSGEYVVSILTESGFKDLGLFSKNTKEIPSIEANLDAIDKYLNSYK
jgi:threonine synthase